MSGSKRQWPGPIDDDLPPKRLRAASISSPLSSPTNDHAAPVEAILNDATATPNIPIIPTTTSVAQEAQVETSPAMSALKTVLEGLKDSLTELPQLQMAVGDLLECIIHSEVKAQHRQAFDELVSNLTNLVALLQSRAVELEPHYGPCSIASVVQVIDEQSKLIKAQQECSLTRQPITMRDDEEMVLKRYRGIGSFFERLQSDILQSLQDESKEQEMETIRKDLCPVYDAYHNAALPISVTKRVGCTQGTRVGLLNTALDWMRNGDAVKIFWLNGMAGTGKTTIAYTLCEILQQDKLPAASFFCSRNSSDCRDVNKIVPTLAYQLSQHSRPYRHELFKALGSYWDTSKRNISAQFRGLISEPFKKLGQAMPKDAIIVIDALDECDDEAGTKTVLDLLIQHAVKLPIKFFIASRPEPTISDSMEARAGALRSILWLHDIAESLVRADIKLYLTEALASINVSPSEIDQLTAKAGKLFIFAATAMRYIKPDGRAVNHRRRLLEVLELQPHPEYLRYQAIDGLYATILSHTLNGNIYTKTELDIRRQVLWTVVCAREPLTVPALAELLDTTAEDIQPAILPLHSVLHQSESTSAISPLHASFPEFLFAEERAGRFHCDEAIQKPPFANYCFKLMGRSLKFNICGLESSYALDSDVPKLQTRVDDAISTGLFYSCRYWGDHLTNAPASPMLLSLLDVFLHQHLLFWMEVLNLKGQIGHGGIVLSQVLVWLPVGDELTKFRDFIQDARDFLTLFASSPATLSTPHIYISALPSTSGGSRVRTTYWPRTQGLLEIQGVATGGRGKSALVTWNVGGSVSSIARSSDGRRVVSGSVDGVSMWDASSGARLLGPLKVHKEVLSVVFSPDNSRIAFSLRDHTIHIWDAHNGDLLVGPIRGHTSYVYSVAFSPDGTHLASGSDDCTVRTWDARAGTAIGDAYKGHQGAVQSVAFSPDGEHLASGSEDRTIRVWNWRTGVAAMGPMEGHTWVVSSISYSSDGLRLASGSFDGTVRVWDMLSGTLLAGPFEGHTYYVKSVSFSPDDTRIVSGSYDRTIRVWEAKSGNLLTGPLKGHSDVISSVHFTADGTRILSGSWDSTIGVWDARHETADATESLGHSAAIYSVVISPNGTRIASSSHDKTICVWDTHTGALVAGPFKGHTDRVCSVAFSPDGARIVSGSYDKTLRTWDASTGALLAGPFKGHTESVNSVTFSPDGARIASGAHDTIIQLWDSHTSEPIAEPFKGHTNNVTSVAFSPDGARIVSGSFDKTVRMWDTNYSSTLWISDAHTDKVRSVAFSPNGSRVVTGSTDGTILVLGVGDGAVLHGPFTGHNNTVYSVAFSPDGMGVVSGSYDRTVRVWDVQSGAVVVGPLKGHTSSVYSVLFSPDGAWVISASADHTVRFWDITAATRPSTTPFEGWLVDLHGWVIDSQSRRLFWVAPNLRDGFWFPTAFNPLASNVHSTTRVDHTTLLGDRWHGCYNPSLGSVQS